MSKRFEVGFVDPKGIIINKPGVGGLFAVGTTVPGNGTTGYAPGCIFLDTDAAAGSQFWINEGSVTSCTFRQIASAVTTFGVVGVAAGYRLARGTIALDGSNPTPVTTGLTTVVSATVTLEGNAAPGVGTSVLTLDPVNYASGALSVYAWKPTSSANPTLIASTGTEVFEWVAVGT